MSMVSNEHAIKLLQRENLALKIELEKERRSGRSNRIPSESGAGGQDPDETRCDLIAQLMAANEEQRSQLQDMEKQLKEVKKPEMKDATSQTILYCSGIDRLMDDSLTYKKLKKQFEEQSDQHQKMQQQLQQQLQQLRQQLQLQRQQQQQQQQQQEQQQQQQQQQQHHYEQNMAEYHIHQQQQLHQNFLHQPHYIQIPLPQTREYDIKSNKLMHHDEKVLLEKLFQLDGLMTVVRDIARAKSLN